MRPSLLHVPFPVRYEVTRVFLHVQVSLDGFELPDDLDLSDYHKLWAFLHSHPLLRGKRFPEQVRIDAWAACSKNYSIRNRSAAFRNGEPLIVSSLGTGEQHGNLRATQIWPIPMQGWHACVSRGKVEYASRCWL